MKNIVLLIIIFLSISSCNKDILELKPLDRLSESSVWEDQSLIELYVNGSYHSVEHDYYGSMWCSLTDEAYNIQNGSSEMVQRGELTADNVGTVSDLGSDESWLNPNTNNMNMFDYWKDAYSGIRNINIYFSKIDAAIIDESIKKQMNGEMKFIRAFIYANLIWRYGGVPIITDIFELNGDYTVSRNSYDECVTYICSELDDAIADLPAQQSLDQMGRASGNAAKALKSRVLLYAASPLNNPSNDLNKWKDAADAAEALLNKGYTLNDDYQHIFLEDNNEIIFARSFTLSNFHYTALYNGRNGSHGWGSNCPVQNLVDDYEMAATGKLPSDPSSGYDPNNPYVGRDPRFYASILYDGAVWAGRETETFDGGLDSRKSNIEAWNATLTGYYLKKFIQEDVPPVYGSTFNATNPYVFFRYGEILLNYAEAKFELGDEQTARTYVNMIRSRNGVDMPPITDAGDALRQRIYHERRIELAFEGQRFFDVRRWKIASITANKPLIAMQIFKQNDGSKTYEPINLMNTGFQNKDYLLPIPFAEINRSKGGLIQNPGY
ncbi:MAG TPA: RagB/SusD family nutrient uptake outer membrane protein [Bacteroidales bacterium]